MRDEDELTLFSLQYSYDKSVPIEQRRPSHVRDIDQAPSILILSMVFQAPP